MVRIADIYLTPRELDARADALTIDASKMQTGHLKDLAMKDICQDRMMAELKRMVGEPEDPR